MYDWYTMATKKSDIALIAKVAQATERDYFPKVKQAREALTARAMEILDNYIAVIQSAQADGNYEVAAESLQWLMEHMPMVDNQRMIDVHIDHQITSKTPAGPAINIGFQLGGMPTLGGALPPVPTVTLIPEGDVKDSDDEQ